MPKKSTIKRAIRKKETGKAPSTQADEPMDELKQGKGPRSAKQAISIKFSEARRAGVKLPPAKKR